MSTEIANRLFLIHYCHRRCRPLQNIMRLPREEAFALAAQMAEENPNTTAFYRFADFSHYYPLRLQTDALLHRQFCAQGGQPKEIHPLSFVLQGSAYLQNWFDNGGIYTIPLAEIPSDSISFTIGDSCAQFERTGAIQMLTKEELLKGVEEAGGDPERYIDSLRGAYSYIEAQIWDDTLVSPYRNAP